MGSLLFDLRHAIRSLSRARGFAAAVIFLLAIGIGANTAVFSVVDAVLLRPLRFGDPDRLVVVESMEPPNLESTRVSLADFRSFHDRARSFDRLAAFTFRGAGLSSGDVVDLAFDLRVSSEFFDVFDGRPLLGRTFSRADREADHGVVLSYGVWQSRFGSDPAVVGRVVHIDQEPFVVLGVMSKDYLDDFWADVWTLRDYATTEADRPDRIAWVYGRLAAGVSVETASAEVRELAHRLAEEHAESNTNVTGRVRAFQTARADEARPNLLALLGGMALLLLIACANVASLMLSRATSRRSEIAVRAALGATRGRIVQQLLVESAVLALAGGALGAVLALPAIDAIVTGFAARIPHAHRAALDARAITFTLALSTITAIVFGLAPAVGASGVRVYAALREGAAHATASARTAASRSALVAVEIGLALALLTSAASVSRSFLRVFLAERGYDERGVFVFGLSLPKTRYGTDDERAAFYEAATNRLATVAGVEAAGACGNLPSMGRGWAEVEIEGRPRVAGDPLARVEVATPGYARAIGMKLVAGRFIEATDTARSPVVAVVNEHIARDWFPGESPIGHRVRVDWNRDAPIAGRWAEIVGVVGDIRTHGLEPAGYDLYFPMSQRPSNGAQFAVRAPHASPEAFSDLRRAIRDVDAHQWISGIHLVPGRAETTLSGMTDRAVDLPRFAAEASSLLAAIALMLAAVGVFGLVSYSVEQRRREIAIRIALGALPRDVIALVLRKNAVIVAIGLAAGLAGSMAATRALGAMLEGAHGFDASSFASAALVLAAVALIASYLPARRATRVSPMVALREE